MFSDDRSNTHFVIGGAVAALLLILLGALVSGGGGNQTLTRTFAASSSQPGVGALPLPQVSLPQLPPNVQQQLTDLYARFAGGAAVPALTPVASGQRARIELRAAQRKGGDVSIAGTLLNISDAPIDVPADAFAFRDSSGTSYTVSGSGSSRLGVGQSTTFDMSVPVPADRGITLIFTLPPDAPVELVVVAQPKS